MRKLSFVLAMILALSGLVGLFAAPAYAADEAAYNYEYVVGEGGYATIAEALAAVKKNEETKPASTHGIKVTADVTESKVGHLIPAGADVTIYALGETKPVITVAEDATGSDVAWLLPRDGSAITLDNVDINNLKNADVIQLEGSENGFDLTVNNVDAYAVARFLRVNAVSSKKYEGSVCNWTFTDTTIENGHAVIQANNRGPKDDIAANVTLNLVIDGCDFTTSNRVLYLNSRNQNVLIKNSTLTSTANNVIYNDANNAVAASTLEVIDSTLSATNANVVAQAHGTATYNFIRTEIYATASSSKYASCLYPRSNGNKAEKVVDLTINLFDCTLEQTGSKETAAVQLEKATKATLNIYGDTTIYSEKHQAIRLCEAGGYDINCYDGTIIGGSAAVKTEATSVGNVYIYGGTYVCGKAPIVSEENNINVYGGKFYTNAETYCEDNEADSVATALENKTFDNVTYTTAVEVTPKLDGVEFNSDFFKVKGAQLYGGTTADSASTVVRVLFMVKADEIDDYDNIAAWYSTTDSVCVNLNGEVPSAIANEYAHAGEYVNETEKTNKVYESVLAGGAKVEADDGYYFIPVSINVSNANFGTNIYLRLFARLDGGEGLALSDVVTINIEDMFFN